MAVEIERDVTVEVIDLEDMPESPFFIGSQPATRMPEFTEAKIRAELGDEWRDQLRALFAATEKAASDE